MLRSRNCLDDLLKRPRGCRKPFSAQSGMTLIELMIGVALALIGLLSITGVLYGFNAQKKSTSGNSDAQVIGGLAAYMIERDLRRAGFGGNSDDVLGCSLHVASQFGEPTPLPFEPIRIVAGVSDRISITYAQGQHGTYFTTLNAPYQGDGLPFKVSNTFGFSPGDFILVSPATTTEADGKPICGLYQITSLPSANSLAHEANIYNTGDAVSLKYNSKSEIHNIGIVDASGNPQLPEQVTYAVTADNELTMTSRATQFQPLAIGEQIVMLKAFYCKDTLNATATTINVCDQVVPTTKAAWKQVLAVRFALVARSGSREPNVVTAGPLQLWPNMVLPTGAVLPALTMSLTDEQTHYRYRVYGSMVPIRNLIWQIPPVPKS